MTLPVVDLPAELRVRDRRLVALVEEGQHQVGDQEHDQRGEDQAPPAAAASAARPAAAGGGSSGVPSVRQGWSGALRGGAALLISWTLRHMPGTARAERRRNAREGAPGDVARAPSTADGRVSP